MQAVAYEVILTVNTLNVPKYVENLLANVGKCAIEEEDREDYGYTYRLSLPSNGHYHGVIKAELERFCRWAERNGAHSHIVGDWHIFTTKEHRKPYYKKDYILFVVTDPVCLNLEKRGLLPR